MINIYYGAGQEPTVEWFERKMPYTNFEHFESVDEIPWPIFASGLGTKRKLRNDKQASTGAVTHAPPA